MTAFFVGAVLAHATLAGLCVSAGMAGSASCFAFGAGVCFARLLGE